MLPARSVSVCGRGPSKSIAVLKAGSDFRDRDALAGGDTSLSVMGVGEEMGWKSEERKTE